MGVLNTNLRLTVAFVLVNVVIIVLFGTLWLLPLFGSLRSGRASVGLLERRYAIERRHLADYEYNLARLGELDRSNGVLPFEDIMPALGRISELALGLDRREFIAAPPIESPVGTDGFGRFFETRVRVGYDGNLWDVLGYIYDLALSPAYIRSFLLDIDEYEQGMVRVEFSVFALQRAAGRSLD